MLLLVPSHKADDESTGRDMNSASRVLVLLSSDTDISANVVVPDTAITTTLGTSDTIETAADGYSQSSYFNPPSAYLTQWKHGREYHDGIQPSRHDSSFGGFQQPTQQPNVHQERRLISQLDQRTLHLYGGSDPNNNRTRRHSHTGLVEFDHFAGPTSSTIRMRARQSISLGAPYQNQSLRTPRLLRGAFRKARKDQSPLLTSASFGTDYATQIPVEEWEGDDLLLPWKAHSSAVDDTSHSSVLTSSSSPKALTHGDRPFSHLTNPRDEHHESDIINNKNDADLDSFDSCDDVDVDGEDNDNNHSLSKIKSPSNPSVLSEQGHRDSSEIVDIDGLSDEEMITDESSRVPLVVNSPICSRTRVGQWIEDGFKKAGQEDRTELDIDMDNDLDADMDTILGMTSDMELIMPEFDDEYLQDLNNDLGQGTHMRGHSTSFSNVASPSFSQSSSTTITCLSSHSSPFPSMSTDSPGSTTLNHGETSLQQSEHQQMKQHSINQDLSSFHRDIDILRRHREELKKSPTQSAESSNTKSETRSMSPSGSNTVARSSLVSSPTLTDKQDKPVSQSPIYFKPSHYRLPDISGASEQHLQQDVAPLHSNQWVTKNKGSIGPMAFQSPSAANEGHHDYIAREHPPISQPSTFLDKCTKMTTQDISLATANMNVLTPQEVQEDYYTRRNMRIQQQRQRRRSTAAIVTATSGGSIESRLFQYEGVTPLASTHLSISSWPTSIHGSDMIHPFDNNNNISNPVVIGGRPLPTSYYIPPSAFRTEAAVAAEREMERKRKEEEEALKDSYLVFPSPTIS